MQGMLSTRVWTLRRKEEGIVFRIKAVRFRYKTDRWLLEG